MRSMKYAAVLGVIISLLVLGHCQGSGLFIALKQGSIPRRCLADLDEQNANHYQDQLQKNLNQFIHHLNEGSHINEPSSSGKMPLVEAVMAGLGFVEVSLLAGALVNGREPHTGVSALMIAMSSDRLEIAQKLLEYGANPDFTAATGITARSLAQGDPNMAFLLKAYDLGGAAAFEDPAGTWTMAKHNETGAQFFYSRSGEATWHRGPSLSWTSTLVDGHLTFRNMITHQVTWVTPDALAWRLVKGPAGGPPFWFNFRTNGTSMQQPAELTDEMAAQAMELSKHYWVNEVTGEATFDEPHPTSWRRFTQDGTGFHYYFHTETGKRAWHAPEELGWRETVSIKHERHYWFHPKTGESSWSPPEHLAWHRRTFAL